MEKVETLVSTHWLNNALSSNNPSLRILDATWLGPASEGRDSYNAAHITGSLHFDLNECRDQSSFYNFTLPSPEEFSKYVGNELGIDNDDTHVVVYENDPTFRMISGPRVWWMFRIFGYDRVSVLDGGLKQWTADGFEVTSRTAPDVAAKDFKATFDRPHLIKGFQDVLTNQKTGEFTLMDSRPPDWFDGSQPSIWPGLKLGHILKTVNIPFTSLLQKECNKVISLEEIRQLFQSRGIDLSQPLVCSCMVGVSACTIALGAYLLGKDDVAIYDGSWDEFSQTAPEDTFVTVPEPEISS